jgi:uncharacterized membrane protein
MKRPALFHMLFPFVMMCIPWIYLAMIWKDLPQTIPTHFGIGGTPDKFGAKSELLIAPAILSVVGILMYFILRNIHKIDPKKKYSATTAAVMGKIAFVVILLLCAVTMLIIYWTVKGKVEGLPAFFCGLSLFMAYLGNLMHSIKPNYFVGFRIPWALENEENWRKTHQLASKIWFAGGLVLAVLSLLLSAEVLIIVFMSSIFLMTVVPVVYSYNIYRLSGKSGNTK